MNNEVLLKNIHLVVNKLMNLGGADYDHDKAASKEAKQQGMIVRDFGIEEWAWPQGVGLYGLCSLQAFYQDERYMEFFKHWFESNIQKGLSSKNINTTAPFLALEELRDYLDNPKYEALCLDRAKWLLDGLSHTKEGGFQHVTSAIGDRNDVIVNEGELWIDTLFMAVLFLNKMGQRYHNPQWVS